MSVICPCGTVAAGDDMDCSLCGRDLTKLRAGVTSPVPSSYPTPPTDVLFRPDGSAPAPRQHDPIQRTHSHHSHNYPDSLHTDDQASEPAYWWPAPQTEPAATASGSGSRKQGVRGRGGAVTGTVIAALVLVLAGLALGYFVIADFL